MGANQVTATQPELGTGWWPGHSTRWRPSAAAMSVHEVLPGDASEIDVASYPLWAEPVGRRLTELAGLEPGWDSYGAPPMSPAAGRTLVELLRGWADYIRSEPLLAPTPAGGVVASWDSQGFAVDVTVEEHNVCVYVVDEAASWEWEGEVTDPDSSLTKWLWTASAGA